MTRRVIIWHPVESLAALCAPLASVSCLAQRLLLSPYFSRFSCHYFLAACPHSPLVLFLNSGPFFLKKNIYISGDSRKNNGEGSQRGKKKNKRRNRGKNIFPV